MTNFQYIHCMNIDELADYLRPSGCPEEYFVGCNANDSCKDCWKAWLEKERDDDDR